MSTKDEPKKAAAQMSADRSEWIITIKEKFNNLIKSKTRNNNFHPVGTKMILSGLELKLKTESDRYELQLMVRLVARGNFQNDRCDVNELYTLVACIETVRVLFFDAFIEEWFVVHIRVKGAFGRSLERYRTDLDQAFYRQRCFSSI